LKDLELHFERQAPAHRRPRVALEQHDAFKPASDIAIVIVFAVALLCFSIPITALAQTPLDGTNRTKLTLGQAIALAEKNYPRIRASLEQQVAAQGGVSVARTAYLPRTDILWQTNRATANNVYGLLLPQGIVPSISGPVLTADNTRRHGAAQAAHWFRGSHSISGYVGHKSTARNREQRRPLPA
jgi:hypothetical protein